MQKKLIALAVAGLASTAAFAQSNVTVYGIADAYVGSYKASSSEQRVTGVNSGGMSSSRIGFKGAEDLGNGLKAIFTLEYGLTLDQNDGIGETTARQQFVGLSGGFGTAVLGRIQTPAFDWAVKYSALGGSAIDPLGNIGQRAGLGFGINSADRMNNAVAYVSPSFAGLTVKVANGQLNAANIGGQEATTSANRLSATYAAADYDNGPLSVGVVYRQVAGAQLDGTSGKEWGLGGAYNFGIAKVLGTYQTSKLEGTDNRNKLWSLTGLVPVGGAGSVALGYARTNLEDTDNGLKTWTVAYLHSLSKRTTAYAGVTRATGDGNIGANYLGATGVTASNGESANGLIAGVRHAF